MRTRWSSHGARPDVGAIPQQRGERLPKAKRARSSHSRSAAAPGAQPPSPALGLQGGRPRRTAASAPEPLPRSLRRGSRGGRAEATAMARRSLRSGEPAPLPRASWPPPVLSLLLLCRPPLPFPYLTCPRPGRELGAPTGLPAGPSPDSRRALLGPALCPRPPTPRAGCGAAPPGVNGSTGGGAVSGSLPAVPPG